MNPKPRALKSRAARATPTAAKSPPAPAEEELTISLRLPRAWVDEIKKLAAAERVKTGYALTRSDVARKALRKGLDDLQLAGSDLSAGQP